MMKTLASQSRAVKEAETQASSCKGAPPPHLPQAQTTQHAHFAQSQGDGVSFFIPFLVSLQQTHRQILELLVSQANRVQ